MKKINKFRCLVTTWKNKLNSNSETHERLNYTNQTLGMNM